MSPSRITYFIPLEVGTNSVFILVTNLFIKTYGS